MLAVDNVADFFLLKLTESILLQAKGAQNLFRGHRSCDAALFATDAEARGFR